MGKSKRITQVEWTITLGDGIDYKIKPLSLVEAKSLMSKLKGLDNIAPETDLEEVPELLDKLIEVCSIILRKTNPSLTVERVGEIVGVNDIKPIMNIGLGGDVTGPTVEEVK